MRPFEILLSESQERMLVVVKKGKEEVVKSIFDKWDLNAEQIGVVTEGGTLRYFMNGDLVGEVPAESLVLGGGAPVYHREYTEPAYFAEAQKFTIDSITEPRDLVVVARQLLTNPNIASKRWVWEQYDSMVGTANMSTNRPSDAAVVNIKGTNRAIALTVDCNARYVNNDPETGTMIAVAEAARNIVCSGGEPSAITNCLNFGNPYNPEVYWQFVGAIKGMGEACRRFETPVTGGNVSFYNQTAKPDGTAAPVFPTPTIGMLGVLKDKSNKMSLDFKYKGDLIYLIGESRNCISSSEYLNSVHGVRLSPAPHFNIEEELLLQKCVKDLIHNNLVNAVHDVSDGGLFVTLFEMSLPGNLGFDIVSDAEVRKDAFLFGEAQSRIVVTVTEDEEREFIDMVAAHGVPVTLLGHVTRGKMVVDGEHFGFIDDLRVLYDDAIGNYMTK
jgi:phosphoribosylformylglycinamidine synthase